MRSSPAGTRRSKDGADLDYTTADGAFFVEYLPTHSSDGREVADGQYAEYEKMPGRCAHLIDPSVAEFEEALRVANEYVSRYKDSRQWDGGGVSLCYSGHGAELTGALVLKDGEITGDQLAEVVAKDLPDDGAERGVELLLDSCFAGAFLADFLSASTFPSLRNKITPRDIWAASLHDELAWELPELSHGALIFTLKNPGNAHVDFWKLGEAVHDNDQDYIRMALQGSVPNPVTYLTEGDQHSIELINGHALQVKGVGYFELPFDQFSPVQMMDTLERARDAGHNRVKFAGT
jgi:hypothetical protein